MKRRLLVCIIALALLPLLICGGGYALFLQRAVSPPAPITINVARGSSFGAVAHRLESAGVVSNLIGLKLLARLRGDAAAIQAGDYHFAEAATPGQILDRLIAGDVELHRLIIPEGFSRKEISERLQQSDFQDAAAFLPLTTDAALIRELGIKAASLEGYLFPETYTFDSSTNSRQLIHAMVDQCLAELTPALLAKAKEQNLNRHQLLTLASIIQKEAGNNSEMPLISAVFHNRLRQGIALQADPTVIYGVKDFDGNLTRRHLREITPYNTYRVPGLPPGPIASPGRAALQAAANPAAVNYLYFVSRGDGSHQFSNTLREHNAAVRRYQLKR
jgi:UPF0755 protein